MDSALEVNFKGGFVVLYHISTHDKMLFILALPIITYAMTDTRLSGFT
jgi:hypothetical protein